MEDLKTSLLVYGSLLMAYASPTTVYFLFRRRAQMLSNGQPIIQIPWWKFFCKCFCLALTFGAIAWIGTIGLLFGHLVHAMNRICPTLTSREGCGRATEGWHTASVLLIQCGCLAIIVIGYRTRAESNRTLQSPAESPYPLVLLICSHTLLVVSWIVCRPLRYSLEIFSIVGTNYWITASIACGFVAILAYIVGITLWAVALVRWYFAWLRGEGRRRPAETQGPRRTESPIDSFEVYP